SEELANFWRDVSPRITVTGYARQVADGRRLNREDDLRAAESTTERTTTDDDMDADARDRVRRDARPGQQGPEVHGDGAGHPVPAPAAGAEAQDHGTAGRAAGPGAHVRPGV